MESYAASAGDEAWWGGVLHDQAVAFMALTLDAKLSPEARLVVQTTNARADEITGHLLDIKDQMGRFDGVGRVEAEIPIDVLAQHVAREVDVERRARAIDEPGRLERIVDLARRVRDGSLRHAPAEAAIASYRLAAQMLARAGQLEQAREWLGSALAAGTVDLGPDHARIAVVARDWSAAFDLLGDCEDREATGLLLEALHGRDGVDAALEFQAAHVPPVAVSGFSLPAIAGWLVERDRWADAEALLDAADDDQLHENPVLLFMRARLRVALLTPAGHRTGIYGSAMAFMQPKLMRDDLEGTRLRAAAIADLRRLELLLGELRAADFAMTVEANRLFLELGSADATVRGPAVEVVRRRAADGATAIDNAWLALAHGIEFDDRPLRSQLEKARLLAGFTDAQLMAALQLALADADPDAILSLIDANRDHMARALQPEVGRGFEVEVLARRGRIAEARERLEAARDALGPETAARLANIILEEEGQNPVALRLEAYGRTGDEADLSLVVAALVDADDERAGDYAARLWRRRRRIEDAITAANALFNAGRDDEHESFLVELGALVDASHRLREHHAWARYRVGALDEARRTVDELRRDDPDRASLRQLAINIALEGGDWHRLGPLVAEDLERADRRDAGQLIQASGLAHAGDNPIADALAQAAVTKAPDDPHILLRAHALAMRRGRDGEPEVGAWLRRAIELSGDNGPIRRVNLRDVVAMRDDGIERSTGLDRMIMSGRIPLSMAASPLGTTMSELILSRLADNPSLPARQRLCLPLIAGNRSPVDLSGAVRFALDPGAILVLQLCGLLDTALGALPAVVTPAGMMPLLMHDLEAASRGQPSRAAQASLLKALVEFGRLTVFDAGEEEDDVQALHARAETVDGRLVHSFPLYEPGSFNERVRDPSPWAERLASPDAVIAALARRGEITGDEERRALDGLGSVGGAWTDEADVDLDRPLVLDSVVLHALEDDVVLDRLIASGTEIHVARTTVRQLDDEIARLRRAHELERSIEAVRATLAKALAPGGRAKPSRFLRERGDERARSAENTPLTSLLQDASTYDVLVSGDRMVSSHPHMVDPAGVTAPVATPLDLLDHLARIGAITPERRRAARLKLREAGAALIPVGADEIVYAAAEGDWRHGPSRALRAIRASLCLPLIRRAVTMPGDRPWLAGTVVAIAQAIRGCWERLPTSALAGTASDYLFEMLPSLATLAQDTPDGPQWAATVTAAAHGLLALPADVPQDRLGDYHEWHDGIVRERLHGRDRDAVGPVLERLRHFMLGQEDVEAEIAGAMAKVPAAVVRGATLRLMPRWMRERVTEDDRVRAALGGSADAVNIAGSEVALDLVADFYRRAFTEDPVDLIGTDGATIASGPVVVDDGVVSASVDGGTGRCTEAGVFADEANVRARTVARLLGDRTMSPHRAEHWTSLIVAGPPAADLFMEFMEEVDATPEAFVARVGETEPGDLQFDHLVERRQAYYCNLLDPSLGDGTLAGILATLAEARGGASNAAAALSATAPLAVSPDLPVATLGRRLDDAGAVAAAFRLARHGDPFSALAGFQLLAQRTGSAECLGAATTLLEELVGPEGTLDDAVHDFAVTGTLSLAFFDLWGVYADAPMSIRRCAALAHAGHAVRALRSYRLERGGLLREVREWAGPRWMIGSMLDRFEADAWIRELLIPDVLGPYLLRRFAAIIDAVPGEDRPSRWVELVRAKQTELVKAGSGLAFGMPGPLDEFGSAMPIETQEGTALATELDASDAGRGEAIMHGLLWAFRPPDDPTELERAAANLVERSGTAGAGTLLAPVLAVAARWRLAGLADRVMDAIHADPARLRLPVHRVAELSVLAAAAAAAGAREETLARHMGRLAFGRLEGAEAASLARFLDVLENLRPGLAASLEKLRCAALLGG